MDFHPLCLVAASGWSAWLLTVWFEVQVLPGPPLFPTGLAFAGQTRSYCKQAIASVLGKIYNAL